MSNDNISLTHNVTFSRVAYFITAWYDAKCKSSGKLLYLVNMFGWLSNLFLHIRNVGVYKTWQNETTYLATAGISGPICDNL